MANLRLFGLSLPTLALLACGSSSNTSQPDTCTNITGTVMSSDGLSIRKPDEDAAACHVVPNPDTTASTTRICEKKTPELSCLGQTDPLGTPVLVTFTGCVDTFGLGADSNDLVVTVLREQPIGSAVATDPGYDLAGTPGHQAEKTPTALIGQVHSRTASATVCDDRGAFTLANVPTETPLIVRVNDQHYPSTERRFIDAYQYNVILRNSVVRSGPRTDSPLVADAAQACTGGARCYVVKKTNAITTTTYRTVPLTAGVSVFEGEDDLFDGQGQGHLAGEVRDCTSEDRIQNAVVQLDATYRKLAYFNVGFPPDLDNIDDPKAEQTRTRTNADGLYSAIAINTQPGGVRTKVGTAITPKVCGDDGVCKCVDGSPNPAWTAADAHEGEAEVLATRSVYVYPDSITILTFDRETYVKH